MCRVECSGEQTTSYLALYNTARLMDISSPIGRWCVGAFIVAFLDGYSCVHCYKCVVHTPPSGRQ